MIVDSRDSSSEREFPVQQEDAAVYCRSNLFTLYSGVFRVMLAKWKKTMEHAQEAERARQLDSLILPSNQEWRYQVYYRLVDLQREIDLGLATADSAQ